MKKIISCFILLTFMFTQNYCFAEVCHLYFLKNTSKSIVKPVVEENISNAKFAIVKSDPYLARLNKNVSNYAIVILQQSSQNMFYYFSSNSNDTINKNVLKSLKNLGIVYQESTNVSYLSTFSQQANRVLNNIPTHYSFDDSNSNLGPVASLNTPVNNVLKGYVGQVSKGSTFKVYLQTAINTSNANKGDSVIAILSQDWVYNGNIIAPQGSTLSGKLAKANHATYGSRNGRVVIEFNQLTTPENKTYNLGTEEIDFSVTNEGKIASSVKNIATGAILGALVGLLIAAGSSASTKNATLIGAGIGAGSALFTSTAEQGVDAEIPIYTELDIVLKKPLSVVFNY